ncbi:lysophospholipid acyltransferase family protein [Luteolibacter pohnpeiensis]|uniref:Lysophospholipid acyltransferase family protein n=1 Tax=Luteolibacter pohnpeiensis TaxID=454153 RepID=A0A934VXK3_9BACT|nr:lysophospholipid acyltransferase family protein [Luteolibacter pohnpeiensis]MBK1883943.1 lysophospholipid acyltransferase family protein [Luteolibacter pohnpeiensis]
MTESDKTRLSRRLGVFGDLPTRAARGAMHLVPWFLEPPLVAGWTAIFFVIASKQRRAVTTNLRALFPEWSRARAIWGAWRVFWNFSVTFVDGLRCETETGGVDWSVEGQKWFEDLAKKQQGCMLLTAHMGNYDIAAPMFSTRFGKPLFAVRSPEREPELQKIREKEMLEKQRHHPFFRTLYNEEGSMLGIELARILNEGNLVAVQGDRVVFEVSPMEVEVEPGLQMTLPKGPLVLARITHAPCYPLFITRIGWRRYQVKISRPLELPPRRRGDDSEATKIWATTLLEVVREHWSQWFVFEEVFRRDSSK